MYFNRITLVGRLTRDPELRTTPEGTSVVRFGLAVSRGSRPEDETDFFEIVAFGTTAETVANYMTKGRLVLVEGRVQTRTYTAGDGTQRKAWDVIANVVRFLEPRSAVEAAAAAPAAAEPEPTPVESGGYDDITMEEPEPPAARTSASRSATPRAPQRPARTSTPPPQEEEPDFDLDFDPEEMGDSEDDPFR
ncbi:MAG: single-stranded DNA-binding protein [Fimbriimonadales bacterium]|jgi:single-strand DNA-binding protein|nr:single-stranded DNA-binding protein [Fimbriimonadales bacterium]GIV14022.1 MAG: hypothetical protein KatS3mg021_2304 [Fimbriimonadales bacterium]CUU35074.1 single-strand DNA-binding protein [Armatimonadetes bacterium GXS]